jgi:branched-chain amino acid transport system permease protein
MLGPTLLALAVSGAAACCGLAGVGYDIVVLFGINAVMVVGFQVFVGNTGIMSFGHVGFMALGAYAAGLVSLSPALKSAVLPSLPRFLEHSSLPMVPSLLIAGAVAAAIAIGFGYVVMRLVGPAASIATFALLVIINEVLSNASSLTEGTQTFSGVPATTTEPWVFGSLVVAAAVAAAAKWSWLGLQARAVRDDPVAAASCGVTTVPGRVVLFAISAFLTGIGGALWAHFLTAFSPSSFYLSQVVTIVVMAILGGVNSVSGALVGALLLSVLDEILRRAEGGFSIGFAHVPAVPELSQLVLGVGLVLLLRWRPEGMLGGWEVRADLSSPANSLETGARVAGEPRLQGVEHGTA